MKRTKKLKRYELIYEPNDKGPDLTKVFEAENIYHAELIARDFLDNVWGKLIFLNEVKK